ncbi:MULTISPECIES: hypothetical protein [Mycolicibacterium]|uniref:Uncharacterized protein n=1 Tax=Mycolicibacterium porcinum TaxID=39693 RepID=A0ABV3VMQ1_9MYCO|nr:hypothetical protein [Mycolicibacterium peregrinum]
MTSEQDPSLTRPDDDQGPPPGRTTVNVSGELLAAARGAVRLVRVKTGRRYSLQQFTNEAFAAQLRVIAETYNDGRAIAPDETPLEKGLPGG